MPKTKLVVIENKLPPLCRGCYYDGGHKCGKPFGQRPTCVTIVDGKVHMGIIVEEKANG